jgi:hypothetical protein
LVGSVEIVGLTIAAIVELGLKPLEFRGRGRHIGEGATRGAVGGPGGAAEIVGIGRDIAEAGNAWPLCRLSRLSLLTFVGSRGGGRRRRRCRAVGLITAQITRRPGRGLAQREQTRTLRRRALGLLCLDRLAVRRWFGTILAFGAASTGAALRTVGRPLDFTLRAALALGRGSSVTAAAARRRLGRSCRAVRPTRPGALGGLRFDLADGFLERQPLAGDFRFGQRRLYAAQLRNQRRTRALIERTAGLSWRVRVKTRDGA